MSEPNFAEIQERWDKGDVTLQMCHRLGQTHKAYGWSAKGLPFLGSPEQQFAYRSGYDGKPFMHNEEKPQ